MRELRNAVERACILSPRRELIPEDFAGLGAAGGIPRTDFSAAIVDPRDAWIEGLPERVDLRALSETLEHDLIARALERSGGKQAEAARALGISRSDLSVQAAQARPAAAELRSVASGGAVQEF